MFKKSLYYFLIIWAACVALIYLLKLYAPGSGLLGINQVHWSTAETFDQTVGMTVIRHYARDGLLAHSGLQDRSETFIQGTFDVPCLGDNKATTKQFTLEGREIPAQSWEGQCLYSKTPPLYFWLSSLILRVTDHMKSIRVFQMFLQIVLLGSLWFYLKQIWSEKSAAAAVLIYSFTHLFWSWGYFIYSHTFALIFISLCFAFFHLKSRWRLFVLANTSFVASFSLWESLLLLNLYPWILCALDRSREKLKGATAITVASIGAFIVYNLMRVNYFGDWHMAFSDLFAISNRYYIFLNQFEWTVTLIHLFDQLISDTFYPTLIVLLFAMLCFSHPKMMKQERKICLALLLSSGAIALMKLSYIVYLPFVFLYLSSIGLVALIAHSLTKMEIIFPRYFNRIAVSIIALAIMYAAPNIVRDISQIPLLWQKTGEKANLIDLAWGNNFVHSTADKISQGDIWEQYHYRLRLIDKVMPPNDEGFPLQAWAGELTMVFDKMSSFKKISFLLDRENMHLFTSCQLWRWDEEKKWRPIQWSILLDKNLGLSHGWVHSLPIDQTKALKLSCGPLKGVNIYEMRWE